MHNKGVLLLGGTGFVGRKLAERLVAEGYLVYIIARNMHNWKKIPGIKCYASSLDNSAVLEKVLPQCTIVFHLATETTPGTSAVHPAKEAESNLLPSLRFLESLQKFPEVFLVYLSSGGAVYGDVDYTPVSEKTALYPISYYGAGKAALEKFILAFCRQTRGKAVILRPSNFYGPGQLYQKGFGVIPAIFYHLLTDDYMQIYGDGETVRDYLFIDDFIDFCIDNLVMGGSPGGAEIYNIGSGQGTTLNQLCCFAENVSGKKLKRKYHTMRSVDVKKIVLNCSQVQQDFNWSSKTDLQTGLKHTWQWFTSLS